MTKQQVDTLMNLIDEYAEVRHINGCWVYNSKTASARQAVIEALSGVQALLIAAPAGPWSLGEMTGNWRDIDLPDHGAVMRIVWKMEDDEGRNDALEAQARAVVAALNAAFPEPSSGRQAQSGAVYAELPDFDSGEEPIWEAVFKWKAANRGPDASKKAMAVESAIIKSLRDFADRTHALRMEQAAPKDDGFYEAVNDMDGLYQAAPKAAPGKACVCGESQAPGTVHRADGPCYVAAPQPAPAPLSDDTKRLAWMADGWTPGHEKLYAKHVLETGGVGDLDDLRTFIDKQIAAHGDKP